MRRPRVFGTVVAVAVVVSLAAGQFALTVNGQRDYLTHVVRYSPALAWVGSYVIEGTMGAALLAGLVVQRGSRWARAWIWLVLVVSSLASVMGNMADALNRHLPIPAVSTRASWPLWVLLGETLAVIVIRHTRETWQISTPLVRPPAALPKRTPGKAVKDNPPKDTGFGDESSDTGAVTGRTPAPVPPSNVLQMVKPRALSSGQQPKSRPKDTAADSKREALREWIGNELLDGRFPTGDTGLRLQAEKAGVSLKTAVRDRDELDAKTKKTVNVLPPAPEGEKP